LLAGLDEAQRRWCAGLWATQVGWGGITRVAQITGLTRPTITRGQRELAQLARPPRRVRHRGAGRPRAEKKSRPW
jgi:hypothetical protein